MGDNKVDNKVDNKLDNMVGNKADNKEEEFDPYKVYTFESAIHPVQAKRNAKYIKEVVDLAKKNLSIAEDVQDEDLIPIAFQNIKTNTSKKIYENSFFLLSSLVSPRNENREVYEKIMNKDAIARGAKVLKNAVAKEKNPRIPTCPAVLQQVTYLLSNLAASKSKEYVVSADIIPIILEILQKEEHPGVLRDALDLLSTLLMGGNSDPKPLKYEITRQIMDRDGMNTIVKVITETEKRSREQHDKIFKNGDEDDAVTTLKEKAAEMQPLDELFTHATSCLMSLSTVRQVAMKDYYERNGQ
mmetsp:Transcript_1850/g.2549  ORF Transcript_1850/g.2549 Transcript_1850/m.2549 type:complete len:300 (-) Transcript_1850:57-956(-)